MAGTTLLFSEVLDKVHKAKTKDQKVKILRDNNTPALRSVLKSSFDPNISVAQNNINAQNTWNNSLGLPQGFDPFATPGFGLTYEQWYQQQMTA